MRYHIKVFTKPEHITDLQSITANLNRQAWRYSIHCLDNLKYRAIDIEGVLLFIKGIQLEPEQIFEYYTSDSDQNIEKICYRLPYNKGIDIILVVNQDKEIITLYMNAKEDKHETLKRELYING